MLSIYKRKKIIVTGHTGFKGSWLCLWLNYIGANVLGISLKAKKTMPEIFNKKNNIKTIYQDIRDAKKIDKIFKKFNPHIVFHLAAQSIVRDSYTKPIETYQTNVIGTLNVFEASRKCSNLVAIINVTSDKCYENLEKKNYFTESDKLGGNDIYSSSKASSEILTKSYRNSFLNIKNYNKSHKILLASTRCGNVIGGGDWSDLRLIPDIVKSISGNKKILVRNPNSIRPWIYILDCLHGYLILGKKLLQKKKSFAEAFNFGPNLRSKAFKVKEIISFFSLKWKKVRFKHISRNNFSENKYLFLNPLKSNKELNWYPLYSTKEALSETINWYRENNKKKLKNSIFYLKKYLKRINKKN